MSLASFLVLLGGPALAGSPLRGPSTVVALVYAIGLLPLAAWVYLTLAQKIPAMFDDLQINGRIGEPREAGSRSYDAFMAELRVWLGSRWWAVMAAALVVLYWFYRPVWMVPAAIEGEVAEPAHLWLRVAVIPVFSLALYGLGLSLVHMAIAMVFAARLLRQYRVVLDPLAPDGAGGLGSIGEIFTLTMIICIVLGGIALAMSAVIISVGLNPFEYLETRLLAGMYLVLLPTTLVVWLWLPHRALVEARALALRPLADAFASAFRDARLAQDEGVETFKAGTDYIAELKRRYELLDASIPTWPLKVPAVRGLSVTALIPLATGLIPTLRVFLAGK
jgi:hypothetical protein